MPGTRKPDIAEVFSSPRLIERAINEAMRAAVLRHKRLGESVYCLRDGQVVRLPPEEIPERFDGQVTANEVTNGHPV